MVSPIEVGERYADHRCFKSCRRLRCPRSLEVARIRTNVSRMCNPLETCGTDRQRVCRGAGDHVKIAAVSSLAEGSVDRNRRNLHGFEPTHQEYAIRWKTV